MKTTYGKVALLLVVILTVSLGVTAVFGMEAPPKTDKLSIVADFYPLYTAALNVVGNCDGVKVSCLTQPNAGCLHDYQLSPTERALLDSADVLIQNGGGMEAFLDPFLPSLSGVTVIDTSVGIDFLSCEDHDHAHGHGHSVNAHTWVDPARYAEQVKRLCEGLCDADPLHAEAYTANAAAYLKKIAVIQQELTDADLPFTDAVVFHESMAYAANALRLPVAATLPLGEDRAASAAELAEAANAIRGKTVLFLYDDQYPVLHETLKDYAEKAAVVRWNTAVIPQEGTDDKDVWLAAMQHNLNAVKEATQ